MRILYTCDDRYVWLMGISMISLFENNKDVDTIEVHVLGYGISENSISILKNIVKKYNRNFIAHEVDSLPVPKKIENNGRWPLICYARLFACYFLKDINRILYLDCDTIVMDKIDDLFSERYSEKPIYGCKDFIGSKYKRLIGMPSSSVNVNGGVLLLNLQKIRDLNVKDRINCFLNDYSNYISYADQDILNGTFWEDIGVLDAKYNVMSIMKILNYKDIIKLKKPEACLTEDEVNNALIRPVIIHFTGYYSIIRPWFRNSNHPYRKEFIKYLQLSPWSNKELEIETKKGEVLWATAIEKLPKSISLYILGCLYCYIRPVVIYIKGKF